MSVKRRLKNEEYRKRKGAERTPAEIKRARLRELGWARITDGVRRRIERNDLPATHVNDKRQYYRTEYLR